MIRSAPRFVLPLALALVAGGLSGCLTPQVKPVLSKAVIDARAHRTVQAAACTELDSPASVTFGFSETTLTELDESALSGIAAQLACHPGVSAVVVGAADLHGTEAEQAKLAQARTDAVVADLRRRGVAAERIQAAPPKAPQKAPPAGDPTRLIVVAEGRRW